MQTFDPSVHRPGLHHHHFGHVHGFTETKTVEMAGPGSADNPLHNRDPAERAQPAPAERVKETGLTERNGVPCSGIGHHAMALRRWANPRKKEGRAAEFSAEFLQLKTQGCSEG